MARRPSLASPPAQLAMEPDISLVHKQAIEGALRWAWQQLIAANDAVLNSGSEEAITAALETQLGRMEYGRRVAPGLKDFDHPVRGAKQRTSDGRIEKQPDLTFRPPISRYQRLTNTAGWGCFVECKLIEDGHASRTVESYSDDGIRRFAKGEYAARMPSAMMIAFVRGNRWPAESLEPLLPLHGATTITRGRSADTCSTKHPRRALVPSCVDVVVIHLWLLVPSKLAA